MLIVTGALIFQPPSTAQATSRQESSYSNGLKVTLDQLSPAAPDSKSTLTLAGSVTNTSDRSLTGINVTLSLSINHFTDPAELTGVTDGTTDVQTRGVLNGTTQISTEIPSGGSQSWQLALPVADLQLGEAGVYLLRLDAALNEDGSITGSTRTFLPWYPTADSVSPVQVAWLWPLSDYPNRDADQVLLNDRTPIELAPGGRLRRLLDLGADAKKQVSWVLDPQLLETVDAMSHGYQVLNSTGQVISGGAPQLAEQWLSQARTVLATTSPYAMAYADPDVTAMSRSDLDADVVLSTTSAPEQASALIGKPVSEGLGWPPGTRTDRATLSLLKTAGVRTVVLDSGAYPVSAGSTDDHAASALIRTESGPLVVVLADHTMSESLGAPGSSAADAVSARQRFLAQAALLAGPPGTPKRTVAIAPSPRWDPNSSVVSDVLAALRTSAFARSTTLAKLLSQTPSDVSRTLAPLTKAQRRAELTTEYLGKIKDNQRQLDLLSAILVNPSDVTTPYRSALLRVQSSSWRIERSEGDQLLERISNEVNGVVNKVRPLSSKTITFASSEGRIPISIANELPVPVKVGLKLTANPSVRLSVDPIEPFVIPANRKVSIEVQATVLGTGPVPVTLQLTTPAGTNYGQTASVTLQTTAYAQTATWVVVIAFVVLTSLIAMSSVRRRRQRRQGADQTGREDLDD
ncbi:MAG: DUF6049 family protein [Actinomycetes bacterium]